MNQTPKQLLEQGIAALKAGDRATARQHFLNVSQMRPDYQDVWLWLSDAADNDTDRRAYLEHVLSLNPASKTATVAQRKLAALHAASAPPVPDPFAPGPNAEPAQPASPPPNDPFFDTPHLPPLSRPPAQPASYPPSATDSFAPSAPDSFQEGGSTQGVPPWMMPPPPDEHTYQPEAPTPSSKPTLTLPEWLPFSDWRLGALLVVVLLIFSFTIIWGISAFVWGQLGSDTPNLTLTADEVLARLRADGLEAEAVRLIEPGDYTGAPLLCVETSRQFTLLSLGTGATGLLFVCPTTAEAEELEAYFDSLGDASALQFVWTFRNDNVLLQLSGEVARDQAHRYEQVMMGLVPAGALPAAEQPPVEPPPVDALPTATLDPFIYPDAGQQSPAEPSAAPPEEAPVLPTDPPLPTAEPLPTEPPPLPTEPPPTLSPVVPPAEPPPTVTPPAEPPPAEPPPAEPPPAEPTIEPTDPPADLARDTPVPDEDSGEGGVEATAQPVIFQGNGQFSTTAFVPPAEYNRVRIEYNDSDALSVTAFAPDDVEGTLLVETLGPYNGSALLRPPVPEEDYFFSIDATGDWLITVEEVPIADDPITNLTGTGDVVSDFFVPDQSNSVPYLFAHNGTGNFVVSLICENIDQVVQDTSGQVEARSEVSLPNERCLWQVEADGDWRIEPDQGDEPSN